MTDDVFEIDADELLHVVDRMASCGSTLQSLAADLERRLSALHLTWQGEAAEAHRLAQAAWGDGLAEMREGLARMRGAAHTAHDNYTAAATANLRMWEQVR
jgi:WXG100 family type VII secretion target